MTHRGLKNYPLSKIYYTIGNYSCNFITDRQHKRCLYLAMVRSQFEHCFIIWRSKLHHQIDKFEQLQKRAIKWILNENYISYSYQAIYYTKCKQINILPISKQFELNDLIFFHKIVFQHIEITLPLTLNGTLATVDYVITNWTVKALYTHQK